MRGKPGTEGQRRKRIWMITGDPGSGKSTVLSKVILDVKTEGYTCGGVLTREVRNKGERMGFRMIDVSSEESATLATVENIAGPRVGKYRIDMKGFSSLASKALDHAARKSDVVVCDEIGPMELFSPDFRRGVEEAVLNTTKPSVCVVHKRLSDPLIDRMRQSGISETYEVTFENRDGLAKQISIEVLSLLKQIR